MKISNEVPAIVQKKDWNKWEVTAEWFLFGQDKTMCKYPALHFFKYQAESEMAVLHKNIKSAQWIINNWLIN